MSPEMRLAKTILVISFFAFGLSVLSYAQPRFNYPTEHIKVGPQFSFQRWTLKDSLGERSIEQIFTPISVYFPVNDNLDFYFSGASVFADLSANAESSFGSFVDTRIRAAWKWEDDWLIHAGVNLPTGKHALDDEETRVNNAATETVLAFPIKRPGQGLELDAGAAYAFSISEEVQAGIGVGYVLKGEYEFRKGSEQSYEPGNEFSITAGLNYRKNQFSWRSHLLLKFYSRDKIDGNDAFKEGSQLEIGSDISAPVKKARIILEAKFVHKNDNQPFDSIGPIPRPNSNYVSDSFWLTNRTIFNFTQQFSLSALLELSKFGDSDLQLGNATIFTYGIGFDLKTSENLIFSALMAFANGNAEHNEIDLSGLVIQGGFSVRY